MNIDEEIIYENNIKKISMEKASEIGKKYGVTRNTIFRKMIEANLVNKLYLPAYCFYTMDEDKEIIYKRYQSGESSELIAKDLCLAGTTVCKILKNNNIEIRPSEENKKIYKTQDQNYFENIDNKRKAYFLGLMYSDGNVHKDNNDMKILLLEKDEKVLSEMSKDIYGFEKLNRWETSKNTKMTTFSFYSPKLKEDLIKNGCMPNKSFKIRLPTFLNDELMGHFIRGMFDGDGCCSCNKDMTGCSMKITTNIDFANDLINYLDKFEISSGIRYYKNTKAVDICVHRRASVIKFGNLIYKDCENLYLDRKKEKFENYVSLRKKYLKDNIHSRNCPIERSLLA